MVKLEVELKEKFILELTEGEASALDAICGYETKRFLEVFCKNMGKYYIAPHITHVESLFTKVRKLSYGVEKVQKARKKIKEVEKELKEIVK